MPLAAYTGRYYNAIGNWFVEITSDIDGLSLAFQGRQTQVHRLRVHGEDRFEWLLSEEASRAAARFAYFEVPTYVFRFERDAHGHVTKLYWEHDMYDGPIGETFFKRPG